MGDCVRCGKKLPADAASIYHHQRRAGKLRIAQLGTLSNRNLGPGSASVDPGRTARARLARGGRRLHRRLGDGACGREAQRHRFHGGVGIGVGRALAGTGFVFKDPHGVRSWLAGIAAGACE